MLHRSTEAKCFFGRRARWKVWLLQPHLYPPNKNVKNYENDFFSASPHARLGWFDGFIVDLNVGFVNIVGWDYDPVRCFCVKDANRWQSRWCAGCCVQEKSGSLDLLLVSWLKCYILCFYSPLNALNFIFQYHMTFNLKQAIFFVW